MVEIIGDVVQPSELIVPRTTTLPAISGSLILSGDALYFGDSSGEAILVG